MEQKDQTPAIFKVDVGGVHHSNASRRHHSRSRNPPRETETTLPRRISSTHGGETRRCTGATVQTSDRGFETPRNHDVPGFGPPRVRGDGASKADNSVVMRPKPRDGVADAAGGAPGELCKASKCSPDWRPEIRHHVQKQLQCYGGSSRTSRSNGAREFRARRCSSIGFESKGRS